MKKDFELLPPIMPNFIRFQLKPGLKQEGFKVNEGIPITDLNDKEAEEYGELMKQAFIKHWQSKQK